MDGLMEINIFSSASTQLQMLETRFLFKQSVPLVVSECSNEFELT